MNRPLLALAVSVGSLLMLSPPLLLVPQQAAQPSTERLERLAESITVKVFASNSSGSGTSIAKQGQVYTVLTNAHVIIPGSPYRIQTPDGKTHTAEVLTDVNFQGNDVVLLQFRSDRNYAIASLETSSSAIAGQPVFAAGFPYDSKGLALSRGEISLLPDRALQGGYQIGYTSEIQQGMSGGPVLNLQGKVIGINGKGAYPVFSHWYAFEDGSQPSEALREKMWRSSWGVPIQTVARLAPRLLPLSGAISNVTHIRENSSEIDSI